MGFLGNTGTLVSIVGAVTFGLIEVSNMIDKRVDKVIEYVDKRHEEVKSSMNELKSMQKDTNVMVLELYKTSNSRR